MLTDEEAFEAVEPFGSFDLKNKNTLLTSNFT